SRGVRHHTSAPIIPRLLMALIQNGAAIPMPAAMAPPSAGPTARLTLKPTLLAATAGGGSGLGTIRGTTACPAGGVEAPVAAMGSVHSRRRPAVATVK